MKVENFISVHEVIQVNRVDIIFQSTKFVTGKDSILPQTFHCSAMFIFCKHLLVM